MIKEEGRAFHQAVMAMLGIGFITLLIAIDQTIVDTALPTIVADLDGFNLYAWVATAFLLTSVVAVPITGHLGDYFGRKPFVVVAIVVFTGASALCGLATSMVFLVLARGLQGIGGGMLMSAGFACIPDLFPQTRQRLHAGLVVAVGFAVGNGIGPTLGGYAIEYFSWRAVFFVNLPIGVISFLLVWKYLPLIRYHEGLAGKFRLDWIGALLIVVALVFLQLSVQELPIYGLSGVTLLVFVPSVLALFVLLKWESRTDQPIIPIMVLRNPVLSGLFQSSLWLGVSMLSLLFYIPLMFQGGFGMSPKESGMMILPFLIAIALVGFLNAHIVPQMANAARILPVGYIFFAAGCFGIAFLGPRTSTTYILCSMFVSGMGLGFILPNLGVFVQEKIECRYVGISTALLQSLRVMGGAIGIGLFGTLISTLFARNVQRALQEKHAEAWYAKLVNMHVLLEQNKQAELVAQLSSAGYDGPALIGAVRNALIDAVHVGIFVVAIVAVLAAWQAMRVPAIEILIQSGKSRCGLPGHVGGASAKWSGRGDGGTKEVEEAIQREGWTDERGE